MLTRYGSNRATGRLHEISRCWTIAAAVPRRRRGRAAGAATHHRDLRGLDRATLGHATKAEPFKIVVQLPVNLFLPAGVRIQADDKDPGLALAFKRCVPAGCFADIDIKDDTIKRLRAASANWKITFKNSGQQDAAVPLSFKGFNQAFDVLLKE